uniref:Uncharacterized protein n=1 Tax=Lygus hesperus TaxID=30085 RepID=A0A0A9Y7U5_LYGHE
MSTDIDTIADVDVEAEADVEVDADVEADADDIETQQMIDSAESDDEHIEIQETLYKFCPPPFQCKCNENGKIHRRRCLRSKNLENFNCIYEVISDVGEIRLESEKLTNVDEMEEKENTRENRVVYYERCSDYAIEFEIPPEVEYPSPS